MIIGNAISQFSIRILSVPATISLWILHTGFWVDSKQWVDSDVWVD